MTTHPRVVFLRGIMGRSGTNFLRDLLLLHPDCVRARRPIWEDFLLDEADRLTGYAEAVSRRWPDKWGVPQPATNQALVAALGDGLCHFLAAGASAKYVLTKTPSVVGLEEFFALFTDAPLIILVRDGRAVVDSAMSSFGWTFERAVREWTRGGQLIRRFDARFRDTHFDRYRIVRYEDLVADVDRAVRDLCDFLGLDPSQLDADAASNLPVRGSSALVDDVTGSGARLHWQPVDKAQLPCRTPGRGWTDSQRRRFTWLAGDTMHELGYPFEPARPDVARQRLADAAWTVRATARWRGRHVRRR